MKTKISSKSKTLITLCILFFSVFCGVTSFTSIKQTTIRALASSELMQDGKIEFGANNFDLHDFWDYEYYDYTKSDLSIPFGNELTISFATADENLINLYGDTWITGNVGLTIQDENSGGCGFNIFFQMWKNGDTYKLALSCMFGGEYAYQPFFLSQFPTDDMGSPKARVMDSQTDSLDFRITKNSFELLSGIELFAENGYPLSDNAIITDITANYSTIKTDGTFITIDGFNSAPSTNTELLTPENSTLTIDGNFLLGLSPMTLTDLLSHFENANLRVFDKNGNEITDLNTYVATGQEIRSYRGATLIDSVTLILKGDVSGDSQVGMTDMAIINAYLSGQGDPDNEFHLTEAQSLAADVNNDGYVTIVDFYIINQHLIGNLDLYNLDEFWLTITDICPVDFVLTNTHTGAEVSYQKQIFVGYSINEMIAMGFISLPIIDGRTTNYTWQNYDGFDFDIPITYYTTFVAEYLFIYEITITNDFMAGSWGYESETKTYTVLQGTSIWDLITPATPPRASGISYYLFNYWCYFEDGYTLYFDGEFNSDIELFAIYYELDYADWREQVYADVRVSLYFPYDTQPSNNSFTVWDFEKGQVFDLEYYLSYQGLNLSQYFISSIIRTDGLDLNAPIHDYTEFIVRLEYNELSISVYANYSNIWSLDEFIHFTYTIPYGATFDINTFELPENLWDWKMEFSHWQRSDGLALNAPITASVQFMAVYVDREIVKVNLITNYVETFGYLNHYKDTTLDASPYDNFWEYAEEVIYNNRHGFEFSHFVRSDGLSMSAPIDKEITITAFFIIPKVAITGYVVFADNRISPLLFTQEIEIFADSTFDIKNYWEKAGLKRITAVNTMPDGSPIYIYEDPQNRNSFFSKWIIEYTKTDGTVFYKSAYNMVSHVEFWAYGSDIASIVIYGLMLNDEGYTPFKETEQQVRIKVEYYSIERLYYTKQKTFLWVIPTGTEYKYADFIVKHTTYFWVDINKIPNFDYLLGTALYGVPKYKSVSGFDFQGWDNGHANGKATMQCRNYTAVYKIPKVEINYYSANNVHVETRYIDPVFVPLPEVNNNMNWLDGFVKYFEDVIVKWDFIELIDDVDARGQAKELVKYLSDRYKQGEFEVYFMTAQPDVRIEVAYGLFKSSAAGITSSTFRYLMGRSSTNDYVYYADLSGVYITGIRYDMRVTYDSGIDKTINFVGGLIDTIGGWFGSIFTGSGLWWIILVVLLILCFPLVWAILKLLLNLILLPIKMLVNWLTKKVE